MMTTLSHSPLCASLDPHRPQEAVWKKTDPYTIILRPIELHHDRDLLMIHNWLGDVFGPEQPLEQLRVMYTIIAESTYAQSFMILLDDDTPISLAEIYEALEDEVKEYFNARPGDFHLQFPVIPLSEAHNDLPVQVLSTCLDYFFSYPEVNNIVWSLFADDSQGNSLAIRAGFSLLDTCFRQSASEKYRMNLYYFSRDEYIMINIKS